jgi:aminoglycoside 3-N-acetyltransferase
MLRNGERVWVDVEQYDTNDGVVDGGYTLEQIAGEYVDQGHSRLGKVGRADAHLFDAIELVAFAVRWLESRYGRAT